MKKLLIAASLATVIAAPAIAADLPFKAAPMITESGYNWSGFYFGFNIGGEDSTVNRRFPNPTSGGFIAGAPFSTDGSDGIFGFHGGVQYQFGTWVLGVEAAVSRGFNEMRTESGVLPVPVGAGPGFTANTTGEHRITNLGTIGPKLGFAFNQFMIYGTGGFALAELQGSYCSSITGQCGFPITNQVGKSWNPGWFAGVGIDYMVHKGPMFDVILGAEYQHFDLRSERAFCFNACGIPTGADYNLSAHGDLFRAKLTIKYNPWPSTGPVVARY